MKQAIDEAHKWGYFGDPDTMEVEVIPVDQYGYIRSDHTKGHSCRCNPIIDGHGWIVHNTLN